MQELYLVGGGWEEPSFRDTFGRFVKAGIRNGECRILLLLAIEDPGGREELTECFTAMFKGFDETSVEVTPLFLSGDNLLSSEALGSIRPTCVFVGGGLTPRYQELLCGNGVLKDFVHSEGIPYGGFSAGSAIASNKALVGGWRVKHGEKDTPILDPDFAEDLEHIQVREGLGFIDYPIDVHGSQWGTIARMIHAVDLEMVRRGLVIDEATMLEMKNGVLRVFGTGQVYRVGKPGSAVEIEIFKAGDVID